MLLISLNTDAASVTAILELPEVQAALESFDIKNSMLVDFSPTGISFKITTQRQRVKIKLGLGARDGALVVNIRDVRLRGISVGGNWLEPLIAKVAGSLPAGVRLSREHGSLELVVPGVFVRAAGTADGALHLIAEIETLGG